MLRKFYLLGLMLILVLSIALIGCSKNPSSAKQTDEDKIEALIDSPEYADFFYSEGNISGVPETFEGATKDTVYPCGVWRQIRNRERTLQITIDGDTARVRFELRLEGTFHLRARNAIGDTIIVDYEKPLQDRFTRRARFVLNEQARHGWELSEISDIVVEPVSTSDINITNLHITCKNSNIDTVIQYSSSPSTFRKGELLCFSAGDTVTLELTVDDTSMSMIGALHRRRHRFGQVGTEPHFPRRFEWREGVLANEFIVPDINETNDIIPQHIFIDLLAHDTVFDNALDNYDSKAWGFIYGIKSSNK